MQKIKTLGLEVNTYSVNNSDFISLTDIAKFKDGERTDYIVQNWMRNRYTVDFLGLWEMINNPNFKPIEFDGFRQESGSNGFSLTPKKWIETVNAVGIVSKSGNGGGTFAHKDIAFEFASWLSPEFKLYLIKEFQRLKIDENERKTLGWDAKRMLTKINYKIHTDAIKENIILPNKISIKNTSLIYANEADVLNVALFGITAADWKKLNKNKDGNMRDYSDVLQLVVLANLENLNAEYIKAGLTQKQRLVMLNASAISQIKSLTGSPSIKKLANRK